MEVQRFALWTIYWSMQLIQSSRAAAGVPSYKRNDRIGHCLDSETVISRSGSYAVGPHVDNCAVMLTVPAEHAVIIKLNSAKYCKSLSEEERKHATIVRGDSPEALFHICGNNVSRFIGVDHSLFAINYVRSSVPLRFKVQLMNQRINCGAYLRNENFGIPLKLKPNDNICRIYMTGEVTMRLYELKKINESSKTGEVKVMMGKDYYNEMKTVSLFRTLEQPGNLTIGCKSAGMLIKGGKKNIEHFIFRVDRLEDNFGRLFAPLECETF